MCIDYKEYSLLFYLFLKIVDQCQPFWNLLKEIDEECWILEPEVSTFGSTYRRIALGTTIFFYTKL